MKKTKMPSRRRKGFRRVLIAAATLFLVNRIFLVGLLFPIQAVRHCEEREGTGRTNLVRRDWAPEIYKTGLVYLTENENAVMLSWARLTLYGWMGGLGVPVDCTEEAPIYGGWWSMSRYGGECLYYVFGRIDNPDIASIKVQVQYEDLAMGRAVRRTAFEWGSSKEDWLEKDGRRYFLFRKSPIDWSEYPSRAYPVAVGYDGAGNEIARVELDQGGGASFG